MQDLSSRMYWTPSYIWGRCQIQTSAGRGLDLKIILIFYGYFMSQVLGWQNEMIIPA